MGSTLWMVLLIVGAVVVLVVAVLLIAIVRTARHISRYAADIWEAGKSVAANTQAIWVLGETNQALQQLAAVARNIESHSGALVIWLERLSRRDAG